MSYNHCTLVGTLAKDPVTKKVGRRTKTDFTIGVERYTGKDTPVEVDYFNIVTWGKLAEISGEYLKVGRKVLVDGTIQVTRTEDGWLTEVIAENLKFLTIPTPVKED
jgi:single-strand DNA-binding protein